MSAVKSCSNPVCGNTESKPGEFKKCSRCKQACYCSKECQLQHWKSGHKKECKPVNEPGSKSSSVGESKSEVSGDQLAILRNECQTMYNNYEMAKNDLEVLNVELEKAKITQKKIEELDQSEGVYYSYGSMYLKQSHEDSRNTVAEKIEKLNKNIEKASVQVQYFEKRYKELESNLMDMK